MNNNNKLKAMPKTAFSKPYDPARALKKKQRKDARERLAAQTKAMLLVDTSGMIDWPKSSGICLPQRRVIG